MKKLLIASTALVASAGFASADIALTGSANIFVNYDSSRATNQIVARNNVDFNVVGSGTTDGGLSFGASLDLESDNDGPNNAAASNVTNDGEVFVSGAFGTLTVGNVADAVDGFGSGDVGFDGLGVDNVGEINKNAGVDAYVLFSTTVGALTMTASTTSNGAGGAEDYSVGVRYAAGDWDFGIGTSRNGTTASTTNVIDVNGSFGDIGVEAFYADQDAAGGNIDGWGVSASMTSGAVTYSFAVADNTTAGVDMAYGIGASYSLGGGASIAGGIASIDRGASRDSVADFGISLSF